MCYTTLQHNTITAIFMLWFKVSSLFSSESKGHIQEVDSQKGPPERLAFLQGEENRR